MLRAAAVAGAGGCWVAAGNGASVLSPRRAEHNMCCAGAIWAALRAIVHQRSVRGAWCLCHTAEPWALHCFYNQSLRARQAHETTSIRVHLGIYTLG